MRYLGGKSRISKQIISVMSAERGEDMTWVETFMGSGKVKARCMADEQGLILIMK